MKTAEQWRTEVGHLTTTPVHPKFFEQGVIEKIQKDAYLTGMERGYVTARTYYLTPADSDARASAIAGMEAVEALLGTL